MSEAKFISTTILTICDVATKLLINFSRLIVPFLKYINPTGGKGRWTLNIRGISSRPVCADSEVPAEV